MKDLTLVLITCGELTEAECLASVEPFREDAEFKEVRNVRPQIMALNRMIDIVETEFFIPLDADMILSEQAWPRVKNAINKHRRNPSWHSILFPLWDTLTEKKILALKVMRTAVMKQVPFRESATPDVEHYGRLTKLGYFCVHDYLRQHPIGNHVIRGPHFCYHKFRDVYQTYRSHNFEWDSGAFMGGTDLRSRAKAHYDYFLYKHLSTGEPDYLYCIAGMMDGILSPVEHRSKDLGDKEYAVPTSSALDQFIRWYAGPMAKPEYMLF